MVWIDETYVEYVVANASIEAFAADRPNVVVCKSMSKVYALSGARAAYLCAAAGRIASLRPFVPPWAVSLPAQIAAVRALQDPVYYAQRYRETHELRIDLERGLDELPGVEVLSGVANFVLCHLAAAGPTAGEVVARCRERGVFLRDVSNMGSELGAHALRIAVKDTAANRRVLSTLRATI